MLYINKIKFRQTDCNEEVRSTQSAMWIVNFLGKYTFCNRYEVIGVQWALIYKKDYTETMKHCSIFISTTYGRF